MLKTTLKELRNAEVAFVSLVDRAATRMPFRILKRETEENTMIDLTGTRMFTKAFKKEPVVVAKAEQKISAIVVMDSSDTEHVKAVETILTDNGFAVENVTKNEDGTLLYAQDDSPLDDSTILKMSEEMIIVVKGFDTANEALRESYDYCSSLSDSGYFAGISEAIKGLDTVLTAVLKSDAPEKAQEVITKFSTYAQTLITAIPPAVFKADMEINELVQKDADADNTNLMSVPTDAPKGIAQNDWDKMSDVDKMAWMKDSTNTPAPGTVQKEEDKTMDTQKTDNNTILQLEEWLKKPMSGSDGTEWLAMSFNDKLAWVAASYNAGGSGKTSKMDHECPDNVSKENWDKMSDEEKGATATSAEDSKVEKAAVKADAEPDANAVALTELTGLMGKLATQVSTLSTKIEENAASQAEKIDEIARKSDAVAATVKGVVVAPATFADLPAKDVGEIKAVKNDPRSGCFDTAFIKKYA